MKHSLRRETCFLGWDKPLLPSATELLRDRYAVDAEWPMEQLTCVLPTSRAIRQIEEELERLAEEHALVLRWPQLVTVGELPDRLYQPRLTLARDFERSLAWTQVLRETETDRLRSLISNPPDADSLGAWLELAVTLRRLHGELAANRLTFRSIVQMCERRAERDRWKLLDELHERYLQKLGQANRSDPHDERQWAVEQQACRHEGTIMLIGAFDLTPMLKEMLGCVEGDLVSLVAAPEAQSRLFDELGVVRPDRWQDQSLPIQDDHLIPAGDVADQAVAVAEKLADFSDNRAVDEVTVGVTDESQVAPIEVELRGCGVSPSRHLGWLVSQTSVGRLLNLTVSYLQRRSWESLAALVRHADLHRLASKALAKRNQSTSETEHDDWFEHLDQLLANHFPSRVDQTLPAAAAESYPLAAALASWLNECLQPFLSDDHRTIADWSEEIRQWIHHVFSEHQSGRQTPARLDQALTAVDSALRRFGEVSSELDVTVSGSSAIEMIAAKLAEVRVVQPPEADDIEILGWLDLALDDAPVLVVNGLNHPFVPEPVTANAFLPATVRTKLRVEESERRFARDLYAMMLMVSTRPHARFIVGRRAADGSPTPPSRLLASAPAGDVARRVRKLLGQPRRSSVVHHSWASGPEVTQLPVPAIEQTPSLKALSVTAFRDYLACPYRFYLRHVLKIKPIDDAASELAANQFGDLVHAAVERFGMSSSKHETSAERIRTQLLDHLHEYAREHYGSDASAAVQLQVKQAARRLEFVAVKQAERINSGWSIHAVEASVDEREIDDDGNKKRPAGVVIDDQFMGLRGRFDRIDRHDGTGDWAILDYKSHGHKPEKKHLRCDAEGESWIDLQLPLYRLMIPFLGIEADPSRVQLGYFNVAEKEQDCGINIAAFSESQLEAAECLIGDCIRGIRAGKFDSTSEAVPFDDYAMILQTNIMRSGLEVEAGNDVTSSLGAGRGA